MKPFLTLGPKEFLTGLSSSAHLSTSGLFYKADGITPLYDAGGTASPDNGLLQAGASPTNLSSNVVVDNIVAGVTSSYDGTPYLYMLGTSGHLYKKTIGASAPTDLRSGTQIPNPANGITVYAPAGGTALLYYWRQANIGTWDISGTYPTGWSDGAYTITQGNNSTFLKPVHQFFGNVYYGNGDRVGALTDDGAQGVTHSSNVLDIPTRQAVGSLTDDGQYLVIAAGDNAVGANSFSINHIYFWDTHSVSWDREHIIKDPFIWAVKNIGGTIYAFGQYGIYQVTFAGGVRKILSRLIGFGTTTDQSVGYGTSRATVYNNDALLFATDTTVDVFGKLQPDVPNAYFKPFKIPSSVGTPTYVSADLDAGRVFVATDSAKLYAYDFNSATHDSGNTAQTVYFPLPEPVDITAIRVVFGEPLASGDSFSISVLTDEDTAETSVGTIAYDATKTIRSKTLRPTGTKAHIEDSFSLKLTFTSGAVKVKKIEVFGDVVTTKNK